MEGTEAHDASLKAPSAASLPCVAPTPTTRPVAGLRHQTIRLETWGDLPHR